MNAFFVWLIILVIGLILVPLYTFIIEKLDLSPDRTDAFTNDNVWLLLHFTTFLFLGMLLPNAFWQGFAFILVWEIIEKLLSKWFPKSFGESSEKALADVVISTVGYMIGQWLQSRTIELTLAGKLKSIYFY